MKRYGNHLLKVLMKEGELWICSEEGVFGNFMHWTP